MSRVLFEWRGYKYFPYEREFARLEVERLFAEAPSESDDGLVLPSTAFRPHQADRVTYFARVIDPRGEVLIPRQAKLEATAHTTERERQATRYSAHGLHEYKGKFNPQVVRAIGNILGLPEDATILDPFCGSGTTILECAHLGWNAVGVDRNPLAARITNSKIRALRQADGALEEWTDSLVAQLAHPTELLSGSDDLPASVMDRALGAGWIEDIVEWEYLSAWFPIPVLAQVVAVRRAIREVVPTVEDQSIFEVVLSDLLRDVSLQEPADLRIRRRKDPQPNYPLLEMLTQTLPERVARVTRARTVIGTVTGHQQALLGDIRSIALQDSVFDAIITSPPYETALPYVDTQRLSLVLLGHIRAGKISATERELIGAREISTRERRELESALAAGDQLLPESVVKLCRELLAASRLPGNGFRRQNRPSLMYRYFRSMAEFFINVKRSLRPGARVALVVGTNRTVLGGQEYVIDTPNLLADVATHCGYARVDAHTMDTYPRYDLHQQNSIDAESLVVLTKR